jgi:hypothetical protein
VNPFERAVHLQRVDDALHGVVPPGWATGRGAFGGLVLGYLVKAMELHEALPGRRARAFAGDVLSAVLPGPVVVRVRTLRQGKHQSNVQATLEQEGQIVATGSAVMSATRPSGMAPFAQMTAPGLGEQPVILAPAGPHFDELYELRSHCHVPFTRAGEPSIEGTLAERGERSAPFDAAAITALLDGWWPVLLQTFDRHRTMATVAFTAQYLLDPVSLPRDARFAMRARAVAGREGFVVELRELWCGAELVALNQQTMALLR